VADGHNIKDDVKVVKIEFFPNSFFAHCEWHIIKYINGEYPIAKADGSGYIPVYRLIGRK
jgi:hypothetical protein